MVVNRVRCLCLALGLTFVGFRYYGLGLLTVLRDALIIAPTGKAVGRHCSPEKGSP